MADIENPPPGSTGDGAGLDVEQHLYARPRAEAQYPGQPEFNEPSALKPPRRRATGDEMERRAEFFIRYAQEHGPVTVRGIYYRAIVEGIAGIEKDDRGYVKVQRQVLALRREGRLDYDHIADATRWMRKPTAYDDVDDALQDTARLYRKALWRDTGEVIEIWIEKDALAGVIYPVTAKFDVPLMVTRGFSSETFCFEAVEAREGDSRPYYVYYLGDFDRAGRDAARSLEEKLKRFADEKNVTVIFKQIAVTEQQIRSLNLPTREPKRASAADKKWPFPFACELDAIPPDYMRDLVTATIERHLPEHQYKALKAVEDSERLSFRRFAQQWSAAQ